MNKLKVGLISAHKISTFEDCKKLNESTSAILKALFKSKRVESINIINPVVKSFKKKSLIKRAKNKFNDYLLNYFVYFIEVFLSVISKNTKKINKVNISKNEYKENKFKIRKNINVDQTIKKDFSYTEISEELKSLNLDFLIRGSGIYIEKGDIISHGSKLGIVSFHHGLNSINRGGPVGFWEVFNNEESGLTLQILNEDLDSGFVISQSSFSTMPYYFLNKKNLYQYTYYCFLSFLNCFSYEELNLSRNVSSPLNNLNNLYRKKILKNPNIYFLFLYLFKITYKSFIKISKSLKYIFFKIINVNPDPQWCIYYTNNSLKSLRKWHSLESVNNNFYADPFLLKIFNINFIIFEKYNFKKQKGEIFYRKALNNKSAERKLISNEEHLSYPYTFKKNGKYYVIPENNKKGINLYEIQSNNKELMAVFITNLLEGPLAEPSYIHHDNHDFLFINSEDRNILRLFYSKDIITQKLIEHPMSPIIVDSRFARGAGRIFNDKNKIVRPSQNLSSNYGGGIIFSYISISTSYFKNIPTIFNIKTDKNLQLVHHFDFNEEIMTIDGVLKK